MVLYLYLILLYINVNIIYHIELFIYAATLTESHCEESVCMLLCDDQVVHSPSWASEGYTLVTRVLSSGHWWVTLIGT